MINHFSQFRMEFWRNTQLLKIKIINKKKLLFKHFDACVITKYYILCNNIKFLGTLFSKLRKNNLFSADFFLLDYQNNEKYQKITSSKYYSD